MGNKKPKIIVIVGPTASGKSALAIKLAKKFNGEIISADSRQIYRGMDIGTAKPPHSNIECGGKPTKNEEFYSNGVRHYLIDIKNPNENYTALEYKRDAIKAIRKILKKKKIPILVGGTGLYVKAVVDNLNIPKVAPNPKLRNKLEKEIEKYGLNFVFNKLIKLDPEAAYIVDPNNPRRIIRALEIAIKTKKPFSAQRKTGKPLFDFLEIGIKWPKNTLDGRINKRVDLMIKKRLTDEVKNLIKKYGKEQQSFDAIGYREVIDYLDKKTSLEEAMELMKKNTRNYAKRQMTWFRKDTRIHWINPHTKKFGVGVKNEKEAEKLTKDFLSS